MKKSTTIKAALITAGAIICASIITGLLSLGKQEEQVFQTGNTNVFSKDHVEGDKIINVGSSDEDIERIVEKTLKVQEERLKKKYPTGHIGFGIKNNSFIVPKGLVPDGFEVYWTTGKVLNQNPQEIKVILPDIIINTATLKNVEISGLTTTLKKQIGSIQRGLAGLGGISLQAEVVGIDKENDLLIVGLGFINR